MKRPYAPWVILTSSRRPLYLWCGEAPEKCGGSSAFVNGQVRIYVGYPKGTKYKKIEIKDYQTDRAMLGVNFEADTIKDITEMGPVCWGYWYP